MNTAKGAIAAIALTALEAAIAPIEQPLDGRCVEASSCIVADMRQPFLPDAPEHFAAATPVRVSERVSSVDTGGFFGFAEAGDRVGFGQGPFSDFYDSQGRRSQA
jgi:hypothetical protein